MRTEEVSLKHTLTDTDVASLARQQSIALQERGSAEDEFTSIKKQYAAKTALADAKVSDLATRISTGWEMRNVLCLIIDERPEGYRFIVRSDNGSIAKRRKLEAHERQMKLTDVEPGPSKYICSALLRIEDEEWHEDFAQVPLTQEERDVLAKVLPVNAFLEITGPRRQLTSGEAPPIKPERPHKKRK